MTTWMSRSMGTLVSTVSRKRRNSCARWRAMHLPMMVPAFTSRAANSEVVPCLLPMRPGQAERLGAIQRLDLRLLIDAEHQRAIWRVEVEADDVAHLVDEQRVCRQLEGFAAVRLERERPPDAMHDRDRQTRGLGHRARTP